MDSDEDVVPGSCIIEDVTNEEVAVAEVTQQQKDEVTPREMEEVEAVESVMVVEATNMVSNSGEIVSETQVCDAVMGITEEEPNDEKEAKVGVESTVTMDVASTNETPVPEATPTELSSAPPISEAMPTEPSATPVISEATPTEPSVSSTLSETPPTELLTISTETDAVTSEPPTALVSTPTEPFVAVDKPETTPTEQ
ncbi:hypothetical protein ANCDUO_24304, partial [Ancylostoma duodenale]